MKKLIAGGAAFLALAMMLPMTAAHADDGHHKRYGKPGHMMQGGGHGHHRWGRGRAGAKIRLQQALERFDANKDGSISQAEVDQYRADRLKAFDTDGDGALSLEEYQALWLDAMKRRMVRSFQRHDSDGDGKVTAEEFTETTRHMVLRRDRNEDGVLNKDDLPRMGRKGQRGRHGHRGKGPRREGRRPVEKKSE